MIPKSLPTFNENDQNTKETSALSQKCVAPNDKRFDEEFPPLTSQEGDQNTTQNSAVNLFDLAPLSVFCGGKKNLPPRPLSGKNTKKQASEFSGKEGNQKSQNRDILPRDDANQSTSSKGIQESQSPVERLYAHVKKKSADSSHGHSKKNSIDSPIDEQARNAKNSRDGKTLKKSIHKASGSNPGCLNNSNSSHVSPVQTASHTRNNSAKNTEKPKKEPEDLEKKTEVNTVTDKSKAVQNNEQKNPLEVKENPSDFFEFYKSEFFDQATPFGLPNSKVANALSFDPEIEELNIPQLSGKETQEDEDVQQEEEEDPQPWLIPNISKDSHSNLNEMTISSANRASQSQNMSNSVAKRSNGSFVSNESTFDSDQFMNYDLINTSLSGQSTSFYNSKSNEHSTPTKIDSFRRGQQQDVYNGAQMQYIPWMNQPFNDPRNQFGFMPLSLNQSAFQFNPSYNGNDRTSAWDDLFSSNWSTPQGQSQQQFMNQSFNVFNANGYMDQMQPTYQGSQSMNLPNYQNAGGINSNSLAYKQRQNPNYQKIKGRNQKRIPENDESSQFYDIVLDRLKYDNRTTLMIKNIPNKYDQPLLLQTINKNHHDKFDFFYLPIDFKNKCNVGYAFINFIDPIYIKEFYEEFDGKKWTKFNSEKICRIKYGRIQGLNALIQHFEASSVMNQQDKKLKPLILTKNSKNAAKNSNMFPKQNLQNIEQLVRQQKATLSDEEITEKN